MDASFDPYYQWLGVAPSDQPATCYQLLGLRQGESDPSLIMAAAERNMAILEAQRGGSHDEHCDRMLAEIRGARDTLLDPKMRSVYDAALQTSAPAAPPVGSMAEPPAPVPMALPVALARSPGGVSSGDPLAPPVPRGHESASNDDADSVSANGGMGAIGWVVSIASIVIMLGAGWLMFSSSDWYAAPETSAEGTKQPESPAGAAAKAEPIVADDSPVVIMQEADGAVILRPFLAELNGEVTLLEEGDADLLVDWDVEAAATWRFRIVRGGTFKVMIEYAAEALWADAEYEISIGAHSKRKCRVRSSGGKAQFHEDEYFLSTPVNGEHTFSLRGVGLANGGLMSLKSIRLIQK